MYNHDLLNNSNVKIQYAHKRFSLYVQIVNNLIEPLLYNSGINIYADKTNVVAANFLYNFGESHNNKELINKWLKGFQEFIKKQDLLSFQRFITLNIEVRKKANESHPIEFLDFISWSIRYSNQIINKTKKYVIDLSFPLFVASCHFWYQELNTEFDILHDDSKAIDFWESAINFLADPKKMEAKDFDYWNVKESYPLRIRKLSLVNSEEHLSIQVADLIASAVNYGLKVGADSLDSFDQSLWESRLFQIDRTPMIPLNDLELEKITNQKPIEGQNPIDYIAEMLAKDS